MTQFYLKTSIECGLFKTKEHSVIEDVGGVFMSYAFLSKKMKICFSISAMWCVHVYTCVRVCDILIFAIYVI